MLSGDPLPWECGDKNYPTFQVGQMLMNEFANSVQNFIMIRRIVSRIIIE